MFETAPDSAPPAAGDAPALEAALAAAGVCARVCAEGRLALISGPPERFASAAPRELAARLARERGFTHVALVLGDAPADAP